MRVIHDFLTCRLPLEEADDFRRLAETRRVSVSAALRRAVLRELKAAEAERQAA